MLAARHSPALDLFCGLIYTFFLAEAFVVAAYLFVRERPLMLELSLGFLAVNLLGWVIWVFYPTAPPWYVDAHGLAVPTAHVASDPAALARVDQLLGIHYFEHLYARSNYVFGTFPSLHVGYSVLAALVSFRLKGAVRVVTTAFALSVAFSAVYLRHHYILDVLAGALLASVVWILLRKGLSEPSLRTS